MVLHILRALFVLLMAAVGWFYLKDPDQFWGTNTSLTLTIALVIAVLLICVDILSPRKKLVLFSGTFFGLLVGVAIAYALSFVVQLLTEQIQPHTRLSEAQIESMQNFINMM